MKVFLLIFLLSLSSTAAIISALASSPRKMVLGWLAVGVFQSLFFLVIGFELIALLNILFTVGSATVLKLFSSLYGSEEIFRAESKISTRNWINGLGQAFTLGAVLTFAFWDVPFVDHFKEDVETKVFASGLVERFPEIPWVFGFILFLTLIVGGTVGRPVWKKVREELK